MIAIIVSVSRIWKPREFIWINIVGLRYKKKVIVHRFFFGGFPHCVRAATSAVPLPLHSCTAFLYGQGCTGRTSLGVATTIANLGGGGLVSHKKYTKFYLKFHTQRKENFFRSSYT